jgi:rSAM/selenodomain-associated transferase 2
LNEERNIAKALENARGVKIERIVADGGSNDRTRDIVKEHNVKLIYSNKGRAIQQNAGAQCAKGEILLFLHADSSLPRGFDSAIRQAYVNNFSFGAFSLGIDAGGLGFRATEIIANARSKYLGLPYGDQAIFVDKKLFEDVGGFPIIPIMEDFLLIKNLTKITGTKPKILSQKVMTSPRRWQQYGLCRVFFINQLVILGYYAGVSPDELANFYKIPSMQMGKTILFKTFKKLLSINGNA